MAFTRLLTRYYYYILVGGVLNPSRQDSFSSLVVPSRKDRLYEVCRETRSLDRVKEIAFMSYMLEPMNSDFLDMVVVVVVLVVVFVVGFV